MIVKIYLTLIFFPLAILATRDTWHRSAHVSMKWQPATDRDPPPPKELFQDAIHTIEQAQVTHPHHGTQFEAFLMMNTGPSLWKERT
jgi:hypothetical protein